jgi:hypothetical protein
MSSNFDVSEAKEVRTITKKNYELCAAAANHITSIGVCNLMLLFYSKTLRSSIFLCR